MRRAISRGQSKSMPLNLTWTSDDGTYIKPLTDFSLRSNGGPYSSITGFDRTLARGDTGEHTLVIDYKVDTEEETHKGGDYGLTLVYTITSS